MQDGTMNAAFFNGLLRITFAGNFYREQKDVYWNSHEVFNDERRLALCARVGSCTCARACVGMNELEAIEERSQSLRVGE